MENQIPLVEKLEGIEKYFGDGEKAYPVMRAAIEQYKNNPIVWKGISGDYNSPVEYVDGLFPGHWDKWWQSWIPRKKDPEYQKMLDQGKDVFGPLYGFRKPGLFRGVAEGIFDNPVGGVTGFGGVMYLGTRYLGPLLISFLSQEPLTPDDAEMVQKMLGDIVAPAAGIAGGVFAGAIGTLSAIDRSVTRAKTRESAEHLSQLFEKLYK